MSRGLSYRRQQTAKRKSKVKRRLKWERWPGVIDEHLIGMRATTPCPCSCRLCGNPRRNQIGGDPILTIQERRAFLTNE